MSNFFDSVLQFFQSIGDFIQFILDSFKQFFHMISLATGFFSTNLNGIPSFVVPLILLTVTCLVVKLVLDLL